jgi:CBS domain-containing protein
MRKERIRRVPVVNKTGMLEGIVSLNDIVLKAEKPDGRRHPEVSFDDVMETLKIICAHPPERHRGAAHSEARTAA